MAQAVIQREPFYVGTQIDIFPKMPNSPTPPFIVLIDAEVFNDPISEFAPILRH